MALTAGRGEAVSARTAAARARTPPRCAAKCRRHCGGGRTRAVDRKFLDRAGPGQGRAGPIIRRRPCLAIRAESRPDHPVESLA